MGIETRQVVNRIFFFVVDGFIRYLGTSMDSTTTTIEIQYRYYFKCADGGANMM